LLNNSVHWASDYPLDIAIGYMTGKSVVSNSKKASKKLPSIEKVSSHVTALFGPEGQLGLGIKAIF